MNTLETQRLYLRQFTLDDHAFILRLLNSPGWLANIGDRNVHDEQQAKNYLSNGPIKSYAAIPLGLSLVGLNEGGTAIGMCGLLQRAYLPNPDIGFALLPGYDGKGFAAEIAMATIEYARETLKIATISGITLPTNTKSIRLLEKIGMHLVESFNRPDTGEKLLLYSTA